MFFFELSDNNDAVKDLILRVIISLEWYQFKIQQFIIIIGETMKYIQIQCINVFGAVWIMFIFYLNSEWEAHSVTNIYEIMFTAPMYLSQYFSIPVQSPGNAWLESTLLRRIGKRFTI